MAESVRPRYGGSKTRTGCVTCKARHVKCDETKPYCLRCERAGRQCEGYRSPSPRNPRDQLKIVNYIPTLRGTLSAHPDAAWDEQRALTFFQYRTALEMAGTFSSDLWSKFILLVAQHQSSVKHALIALGTVHEAFTKSEERQAPASAYALQHYGRAIHEVVATRNTKTRESVEIALVSCILFSCLESLRGYYQSAISHLLSGMRVLDEEQTRNPSAHHAYIPRVMLRNLFVRMDSHIMNVGAPTYAAGISLSKQIAPAIPKCFASIDEALDEFEILFNHASHILYQADTFAGDPDYDALALQDLQNETDLIESVRLEWQEAYNAMLLSGIPKLQVRDPPYLLLNIYNSVLRIMLNVDLLKPDCDFDGFVDVFREVVDNAEEFIFKTSIISSPSASATHSPSPSARPISNANTPSHTPIASPLPPSLPPTPPPLAPKAPARVTPTFSLTMGVVASLYFAASRCRCAPVRHKALAVLRICNRREGFWDSRLAASVAERLIGIEEANLQAYQEQQAPAHAHAHRSAGVAVDVSNYQSIPERFRVKVVDIRFGPEDTGQARYSMTYSVDAYLAKEQGRGQPFTELVTWGSEPNPAMRLRDGGVP